MAGNISEPSVTLNIIPASQLARVEDHKVLIVGQQLAAATATSGELIQDQPNDGSENTLFVRNSHLAGMVREFKKLNKKTRLDIIPLDDASGTPGTAVLAITGPATEAGSFFLTVGSGTNHRYEISVADEDTETEIGDAIDTAITADLDCPFSSSNAAGTVTFTSLHDGTLSDAWDVRVEDSVAGVGFTVTGWTGGATDPTITTLLDPVANIRYNTIIWPFSWAITTLETFLDARFNLTNDVKDGVGLQVYKGTYAGLIAYANFNSQSLVIIGNKTVNETLRKGTATPEMPDIICAQIGAIRSLRLTEGAPLTQFLTTVSSNDQFGGPELSSLPYFNTGLPNLPVSRPDDFFTQDEQDDLTDNGVAIIGPNKAFNTTIFGEFVTTYLTNTAGNADTSYKFLNTIDQASVVREFFFNNYKSRYAQSRLTAGDLIAGRDMANEASIRAFSGELYDELAEQTILQSGTAAKKDFNDNLSITVTVSSGQVQIDMAPLLVGQLRLIIGTIQINFGD